jgi:hypothetical protein
LSSQRVSGSGDEDGTADDLAVVLVVQRGVGIGGRAAPDRNSRRARAPDEGDEFA